MLRKAPKDFDIATNATPNQVRNLFRNARIIGRRFKLVHILFSREVIEVATFRGHQPISNNHQTNDRGMLVQDNVFGTLEEDAWRRDFTINSLYYNIQDSSIIDFTQGVADINQRIIRVIGEPVTRYQEDPVRMLRAIRFAAKLNFEIDKETADPIHHLNHLIAQVSGSRLFDEMNKLYQCGESGRVQPLLDKFDLFQYLFPLTAQLYESEYPVRAMLKLALESTDNRIHAGKPVNVAFIYAILLWFPMVHRAAELHDTGVDPLPALEQSMSQIISEQNKIIMIPKRHAIVMREIWLLQYRFVKRSGNRALTLIQHPRFRAAYDFLALRALAGDGDMELANWWTHFQEANEETQAEMIAECSSVQSTMK